jgi:hypothetical protein
MKEQDIAVLAGNYCSPFTQWNRSSWIRSKPIRRDSFSGLPFSPGLVPLVGHIAIKDNYYYWITILAYRLLAHLEFTSLLELDYINPICRYLTQGRVPVDLTSQQRMDALRIYCDEGGHALFVEELAGQLKENFAIAQGILPRPKFAHTLDTIIQENQTNLSPRLIQLFFVAISETLITKTLSLIPKDMRVAAIVRSVISDHAVDEALHNIYFRGLFPLLWNSLSPVEKEAMGRLLPQLVWAFLSPEKELEQNILVQGLGFHPSTAQDILEETYPLEQVIELVQSTAKPTLKIFEYAGVFMIPSVEEAFINSGLYM